MTSSSNRKLNFPARHAKAINMLTSALDRKRFWHVLPDDESDIAQAINLLDNQTKIILPSTSSLDEFLNEHPFVYLCTTADLETIATFDSTTRLLWSNKAGSEKFKLSEGKEQAEALSFAGLQGWRLPSERELETFAMHKLNPHQEGEDGLSAGESTTNSWLTSTSVHRIPVDHIWRENKKSGCIFACHEIWQKSSPQKMLLDLAMQGWILTSPDHDTFTATPDSSWSELSSEELINTVFDKNLQLLATEPNEPTTRRHRRTQQQVRGQRLATEPNEPTTLIGSQGFETLIASISSALDLLGFRTNTISLKSLKTIIHEPFIDIDHTPCRLPKLDATQLADPDKGLWELWGEDTAQLKSHDLVARDPGQDVQWRAIAIDFGTSSTVVASETPTGGRELLRIGVRDFYQAVQPQHFENPTVLECLDFPAFHTAWTANAYRPELNWDWMRAAHEAQASFRDNPGDTQVLASIMPRLKQWALRSERNRIRFSDRQGNEIEVPPLSDRNPVRGQPLPASTQDPFDPIELYAWYLGMAINWRGRGLFLKYYLSFPVKYERNVKDCILASFRRGLQRSLPQTLIEHHPHLLNDFEVSDLASEPAAYVAAALPHLQIEPTDEGVPYAVFDFGGGTSDFDFGLLRWANDEEDAQGYERVYEHLASSGDNYLGGENLLEHLVFESFRYNLDTLRQSRIQFTLPLDAQPFAGSEAFLANTQAAQTNSVMLAAKLRSFLEEEEPNLPAQIKLDLINADGEKQPCELLLDTQALDNVLAGKIRKGAEAFLAELARIQPQFPSQAPIHLLLAGNGCRSRYISDLFDTEGNQWAELLQQAFGDAAPEIIVHSPLPIDETNPHAPTAKTGVALGLLRVAPGKNVLLKNHVHAQHDGQAPFAWFVGRLRRGRLEPELSPETTYGEWRELGPLQAGIFYLYATTSPRARSGIPEGDPELSMQRLSFPGADEGSKVFAKASAPNLIELVARRDAPTDKTQDAPKRVMLE